MKSTTSITGRIIDSCEEFITEMNVIEILVLYKFEAKLQRTRKITRLIRYSPTASVVVAFELVSVALVLFDVVPGMPFVVVVTGVVMGIGCVSITS